MAGGDAYPAQLLVRCCFCWGFNTPNFSKVLLCRGVLLAALLGSLPHALAQTCKPLCSFDAHTQSCQISRWYTAALLERLQGDSVWGEIAAQGFVCESLNGSDCANATLCSVSGSGCATDRAWMARKLAGPLQGMQGAKGASLGAQKCGLLGQVLAGEAECMEMPSQAECDAYNGTRGCLWDPVRQSCGIPPNLVLALLRQEGERERERDSSDGT